MDVISLKPERWAQLEEFARQRGKDPVDALAAFFDGELRDFEDAVMKSFMRSTSATGADDPSKVDARNPKRGR